MFILFCRIIEEVNNCQKSQHKNVIRIFGVATWQGSFAIIMEYLPGGTLAEFVEDDNVVIGSHLNLRFCLEISSGLAYLHSLVPKKLIHGDLKANNVLLNASLHCKIADFGSSVLLSYTKHTATSTRKTYQQSEFTVMYAAPEILSGIAKEKTPALDTYSFSLIIYVILKREEVVSNAISENLLVEKIKNGERPNLSFINDLSKQFSDQAFDIIKHLKMIMEQCWAHDPSNRPTMVDVHQNLLRLQAKKDGNGNIVATEVATALEAKIVNIPFRENYQCAPLDRFCPPHFQLFQSGEKLLSDISFLKQLCLYLQRNA